MAQRRLFWCDISFFALSLFLKDPAHVAHVAHDDGREGEDGLP